MLNTAPSFEIYNSSVVEGDEKKIEEQLEKDGFKLGQRKGSMGSFSFGKGFNNSMSLIEETDDEQELGLKENEGVSSGLVMQSFDDEAGKDEYYRRMAEDNPSSALYLGKYARVLESKGDLEGAEEYYFRASFVDPNDGEILMIYAKLVWKLHRDRERAQDYFERAILVCPQDSDVLAAYARFLWEIEEEKGEDFQENNQNKDEENQTYALTEGIGGVNDEGYYKRIVDENPESSLALRNYAHFLYKTKGDAKSAEDTYTRAIHSDPTNGEIKSEYAQLIWEVHHDRPRALFCFEQALLASPENSNVLAAYARFLWEAGEDEEDNP